MPASMQLEVEAVDLVAENHGRFFLVRSYTVEGGAFRMEASDDALYLRNALKVDPPISRTWGISRSEKGSEASRSIFDKAILWFSP